MSKLSRKAFTMIKKHIVKAKEAPLVTKDLTAMSFVIGLVPNMPKGSKPRAYCYHLQYDYHPNLTFGLIARDAEILNAVRGKSAKFQERFEDPPVLFSIGGDDVPPDWQEEFQDLLSSLWAYGVSKTLEDTLNLIP
jgi:hypothetical protein